MYEHYEEDKYMSKVLRLQEDAEEQIFYELRMAGIEFTHSWTQDNVLKITIEHKEDYAIAMEIMRLEAPTNSQSVFGVASEKVLVFTFDTP